MVTHLILQFHHEFVCLLMSWEPRLSMLSQETCLLSISRPPEAELLGGTGDVGWRR